MSTIATTTSPASGSPPSVNEDPTALAILPNTQVQIPSVTKPKTKPRRRVTTDEKRSQHNAIERARRNTLNGRFATLGHLIPSLASHRNPSKAAVVNGSISHLTYQREQRLLAAKLLRRICPEHDTLLAEVNHWRKMYGQPLKEGGFAWTAEVDEVCSVDKEIFGTFEMENENDENDDPVDVPYDYTTVNAPVNGIITPRSSNELDVMARQQAMYAQQQLNQNMPVQDKHVATVNGITWSTDYASTIAGGNVQHQASVAPAPAPVQFPSVVSDRIDSSSNSPTNSHQGAILTPLSSDFGTYTHSPSPASSQNDDKAKIQQARSWTQQPQQQQLFVQPHHQPQPQPPMQYLNYGQVHVQQPNAPFANATFENLIAGMFPSGPANPAQLHQWCKDGVLEQSHAGFESSVPTGMTHDLHKNMWAQPATAESF